MMKGYKKIDLETDALQVKLALTVSKSPIGNMIYLVVLWVWWSAI
jgi:hypothetical protein